MIANADASAQLRTRIGVANPPQSIIKKKGLPQKVSVDWYDPDLFNEFPAEFRARFIKSGVALPLMHHWVNGRPPREIKTMPHEAFMEKYGNEVLALYELPTKAEMKKKKPPPPPSEDSDSDSDSGSSSSSSSSDSDSDAGSGANDNEDMDEGND